MVINSFLPYLVKKILVEDKAKVSQGNEDIKQQVHREAAWLM